MQQKLKGDIFNIEQVYLMKQVSNIFDSIWNILCHLDNGIISTIESFEAFGLILHHFQ